MDFARQQRDPKKHLLGITVVVLLHLFIIYALVTGLARKAVEVIKKPLDAKIIEEIKAPPPPPPPPPPEVKQIERPQQRIEPPPQPFVPPPEVEVPQVQTAPVISATTATPPTEPHVIEPPAPPAPPAPPPKPSVIRGVNCPGQPPKPEYPRNAMREGISGTVFIRATVNPDGSVTNPRILKVEGMSLNDARKYFSSGLFANATQYSCGTQDTPTEVDIPYEFTIQQ